MKIEFNKDDLEALECGIEEWKKIAEGEKSKMLPTCALYESADHDGTLFCEQCVIRQATGEVYCMSTPLDECYKAYANYLCKANDMYLWLKELHGRLKKVVEFERAAAADKLFVLEFKCKGIKDES